MKKYKKNNHMIINKEEADLLMDERRRLAKEHVTLDNMLKHMDIEDVEPVIKRQQELEITLKKIMDVLAILN
jgi:hypothetical protein